MTFMPYIYILIDQVNHFTFTFNNVHELFVIFETWVGILDQALFIKFIVGIENFDQEQFLNSVELFEGHEADFHSNFHNKVLSLQVLN